MNFSFYTVSSEYCDFLRKTDPRVPYTKEEKSNRPFVGIVFSVNGFQYYAPLTSPKPKHLHMKNQIDFLKINEGKWGAINFNNMIPVPESSLSKVEMRPSDEDPEKEAAYKRLLSNQLSWCNSHKKEILKQAEKLYWTIVRQRGWKDLSDRCCDFVNDEKYCLEYSHNCADKQ